MKIIFIIVFLLETLSLSGQGFYNFLNGTDFPDANSSKYIEGKIILSGIELDQVNRRQGIGFYLHISVK
jgi:hypothetical protein